MSERNNRDFQERWNAQERANMRFQAYVVLSCLAAGVVVYVLSNIRTLR